MTKDCTGET